MYVNVLVHVVNCEVKSAHALLQRSSHVISYWKSQLSTSAESWESTSLVLVIRWRQYAKSIQRPVQTTISGTLWCNLELTPALDGRDVSLRRDHWCRQCSRRCSCCSILVRPLALELNQQATAHAYTSTTDVTLGAAEIVEALYGRTSATHEFMSMGFQDPDTVPPEYCEVGQGLL